MSHSDRTYFLTINGRPVPVSEQVYRAYHHFSRKEEYFSVDLKTERFVCDQETRTARFIPSREDSYERLLEVDHQFSSADARVEEKAVAAALVQDLLNHLTEVEKQIIHQLYYLEHSEREASAALGMKRTTFQNRKKAILKKLLKLLKEN